MAGAGAEVRELIGAEDHVGSSHGCCGLGGWLRPAPCPAVDRHDDRLGTLLAENERRLVQAVPEIRQVLGEVVGNLGEVERTVQALPAFNRGWACATDGHYLNFVFPITPEVARVDDGAGRCNPEAGPRGRDQQGQVKVAGPGLSDRDDGLAELLGATTRPGEGR